MWRNFLKILTFSIFFNGIFCRMRKNLAEIALDQEVVSIKNYMFWPNATVPFYVNPEHFDHEQSLAILTALSMFAFKTCLKFAPVMAAPQSNEHVMVFENPNGIRRCVLDTVGHSFFEPHIVILGYDCLQSPNVDMMIMRSLGFPFEHNKPSRSVYIDVLHENIEPGHTDLFTVEAVQAMELSALPYDINSVMHFGDRDYSKNGHRTIMFKDPEMRQNRVGLTHMDLRKIDAVYGPECRNRDRQEKLDLCQSYPGVARRKREARPDEVEQAEATVKVVSEKDIEIKKEGKTEVVGVSSNTENVRSAIQNVKGDKNDEINDTAVEQKREDSDKQNKNVVKDIIIDVTKSLRINPHITPPPHIQLISLNAELGIADGLQDLVDNVFKISKLALNNAREKYCFNNTIGIKPSLRSTNTNATDVDILGIVDLVVQYVNDMINHAKANLTQFCEESESIDRYSRYGCHAGNGRPCPQSYRSTKSGPVKHSTQHRPTFIASTRVASQQKDIFARDNQGNRKKRSVDIEAVTEQFKKQDEEDNNTPNKERDSGNDEIINTDRNTVKDDNSGNGATEMFNKDENDGAIKRNKETDKDIEAEGKREGNNETRGEINDIEIKKKNENEAKNMNQTEKIKGSKESMEVENKKSLKDDSPPVRRRGRYYRRREYDSSVSVERDTNQKFIEPSSEFDEGQRDPRQNKAELERIEREKVEEKQLKHRLEMKKKRDEEYDKKFQKHLPEWSNELALKRDAFTKSSIYTARTTRKVKTTPADIMDDKPKIKRMRDRNENKHTADRDSDQKRYKIKKLEPVEIYEYERENKKYGDTEDGKYKKHKDSDAEYGKIKEYDEEETEYKQPEKSKPKEKIYNIQMESEETEKVEKIMTSKKARPAMSMKRKKESDGESAEKIRKERKRKEEIDKQKSVEDEIAKRKDEPSGEKSREISRMNLPRLVKLTKANEEFYKDRRWPGGEVRYVIQEDTTYDTEGLRRRIEEVNDILKEKTCVYLKEITEDQATMYEDYLVIDNSPDYVTGRVGGRQKFGSIELFRGDQHRQHTAMMVMAWLGFYFEVSRHDRDKYIRVHNRHIRPDKLHHFEKIRSDATLSLPYDYASATQPAWQYWRQIGRKGISTVATYKQKDPDGAIMKSMGQNEKLLSDIDIVKINSVYGLSCKRNQRAESDTKTRTKKKKPKAKQDRDTSSSSYSSSWVSVDSNDYSSTE